MVKSPSTVEGNLVIAEKGVAKSIDGVPVGMGNRTCDGQQRRSVAGAGGESPADDQRHHNQDGADSVSCHRLTPRWTVGQAATILRRVRQPPRQRIQCHLVPECAEPADRPHRRLGHI